MPYHFPHPWRFALNPPSETTLRFLPKAYRFDRWKQAFCVQQEEESQSPGEGADGAEGVRECSRIEPNQS